MRITYFAIFAPCVNVNLITDDFGNEVKMEDCSYAAFTSAKIFHTGMTFEAAKFRSIVDCAEMH